MPKILATDSCFAVIVSFNAHEQHRDAFRAAVLDNAAESLRVEPGCRVFDVCEDQEGKFVLYELYHSPAAFAQHLNTQHFLDFDARCKNWVKEKTVIQATRLQNAEMDFGL